jgi:hypothetical protein
MYLYNVSQLKFDEINRVRIEILNWLSYKSDCLKSKEREKDRRIYMGKERAYSAKPSITSGYQCRASLPGLTVLLSMGAGEADGGKRGWWGQARLVGAGEANGGRKPPASCPSLRPNATKATGPNPVPTKLRDRIPQQCEIWFSTASPLLSRQCCLLT